MLPCINAKACSGHVLVKQVLVPRFLVVCSAVKLTFHSGANVWSSDATATARLPAANSWLTSVTTASYRCMVLAG